MSWFLKARPFNGYGIAFDDVNDCEGGKADRARTFQSNGSCLATFSQRLTNFRVSNHRPLKSHPSIFGSWPTFDRIVESLANLRILEDCRH